MRLLNEGKYDWRNDPGILKKVNECLLCRACVVNCPASVATDEIMLLARRDFLKIKGLTLFQKLVYRGSLSHRERLERASILMRWYKKSGIRNILYLQTLKKILKQLLYYEAFLPQNMTVPALSVLPRVVTPRDKVKFKVNYFVGCASNVFNSQTVITLVYY
jgi:glycolate oxidase iron-sulfur subunit